MIVRIDDYPSGIRPVQPGQLDDFDRMLEIFADNGVEVHLGIVPATYEKFKRPVNAIPCMHGYEHGYTEKSAILTGCGDIYNSKTLGTFDEFVGLPERKILDKLRAGKKLLETAFKREVDTFIPCCNTLDIRLARLLREAGFKRILCENIVNSRIPVIKSDYYGRLEGMDFGKRHEVVTLHMTWEWDVIRDKGWEYWTSLVKKLAGTDAPAREYKILFKYPIRYRREKFFNTLDLYYKSLRSENFLFLITIDSDDKELNNQEFFDRLKGYRNLKCTISECKSKIEAVNYGIAEEDWDIVVIVSDDMIPKVSGLDNIIRKRMGEMYPDTDGALWFNDGFQTDKINTIQIMGRKWFDRWGFVYHEDYVSQRCDVEFQNLAKRFKRIKYYPDVIIRHEHADFGLAEYDKLLLHNYTFIKRDEEVYNQREKIGFPVKIPKIAHFIWSANTPMSYLRYMTYVTFKEHHPNWKVMFHHVRGCGNKQTWVGKEKLEFDRTGIEYLPDITPQELVNEFVDGILPNYASDLIRWKALYEYGGFYFDLDQLFLKPFDELTDYDIVWGGERINYSGVVGMFKRCPLAKEMYERTKQKLSEGVTSYCEAGNWLWSSFVSSGEGLSLLKYYKTFKTPMRYFYPIEESYLMKDYYEGKQPPTADSFALHWFGGHPDSQAFNARPREEIDQILEQWNI